MLSQWLLNNLNKYYYFSQHLINFLNDNNYYVPYLQKVFKVLFTHPKYKEKVDMAVFETVFWNNQLNLYELKRSLVDFCIKTSKK